MAEIERIGVADARGKVQAKQALLVCVYADEAKFNGARLEGAIPLASLEARAATLPKGGDISITHCLRNETLDFLKRASQDCDISLGFRATRCLPP
jgi:hypothetical protein